MSEESPHGRLRHGRSPLRAPAPYPEGSSEQEAASALGQVPARLVRNEILHRPPAPKWRAIMGGRLSPQRGKSTSAAYLSPAKFAAPNNHGRLVLSMWCWLPCTPSVRIFVHDDHIPEHAASRKTPSPKVSHGRIQPSSFCTACEIDASWQSPMQLLAWELA